MPSAKFTSVEINRLARTFEESIGDFEDLRYMLERVDRRLDEVVSRTARFYQAILAILLAAQDGDWMPQLLHAIVDDRKRYGAGLADACEAALATLDKRSLSLLPASSADPVTALLMQNGEPFVDRDRLRPRFGAFVNAAAPARVFVVRGPAAAGKSHLWYFFNHLAGATGSDHRTYVDVATMLPGPVGARDLMVKLATRMNLDTSLLSTDQLAQEARVADKMCDWFIGQSQGFQQRGQRWWIVIDGLDAPFLTAGGIDLVLKLAIAIARQEAQSCYLLLLGLKEPVPSSAKSLVVDENLDGLTEDDISAFIERLATALGKTIEPEALRLVTSKTLSGQRFPFGHAEMDVIKYRLKELPDLFRTATTTSTTTAQGH